jgi:hypothetical protein
MLLTLQVLTILAVSIAMALSLAHALEFPGKLRLSRETYLDMQMIYYPGFTIGGMVGEAGGLLATLALLWATENAVAWRLILAALFCLLVMHAVYWLVTHPVNNFWLKDTNVDRASNSFFSFIPVQRATGKKPDWKELRNRWEYSHVVRAGLGLAGFLLIVTAVAL